MSKRHIESAREQYGIEDWGAGYFGISASGHVVAHPNGKESANIDLPEVISKAKDAGLQLPMIIRFPEIISSQMERLTTAFKNSIWEYSYTGQHRAVFPFKVNQRREFIENIVKCGRQLDYGLEVGSKTEFVAALSYKLGENALVICNGFKDKAFLRLGFHAAAMGKNIIMVVEGPDELRNIIELSKEFPSCPQIGARVKLYSRGSGKWAKSSGEASKFGLTTPELLECLDLIKANDMIDKFSMLHFHIGSQITQMNRVKNAIKEAARVYAKVFGMGLTTKYLNIGGGIGVDYDGSKTSFQSSANYSLQEFTNGIVYEVGEVCRNENVPCPDIVTESGRVIAAYHSVVVTDIREIQGIETNREECRARVTEGAKLHKNIVELEYILDNINRKNFVESYHDATDYYDEIFTLFNLGYIDLSQRGVAENIFTQICRRALQFSCLEKHPLEEFVNLQQRMVTKYLANFSIFQSIPDSWAINQLFPVLPLSHHEKQPSHKASIVDITCDSDGCLEQFIDRRDIKTVLDLHDPEGRPYYLGFFLVGAYQESLANEHNLLGAINEVEVITNDLGSWEINKITKGEPIFELLENRNYERDEIVGSLSHQLKSSSTFDAAVKDIANLMENPPYLAP